VSGGPPPLPLELAEYLAAHTELLRQVVQGQQFQQPRDGHNVHQPQAASYMNFLGTQPPLFNVTEESLDANAWICTIESNFSLLVVPCSDANKAFFLPRSNFAILLVFGGIITKLCS